MEGLLSYNLFSATNESSATLNIIVIQQMYLWNTLIAYPQNLK